MGHVWGALAAISIFSFWPNNFDANFGISLILSGIFTYCFWRLSDRFSGCRGWLKWAKENKDNELKQSPPPLLSRVRVRILARSHAAAMEPFGARIKP